MINSAYRLSQGQRIILSSLIANESDTNEAEQAQIELKAEWSLLTCLTRTSTFITIELEDLFNILINDIVLCPRQ